MKKGMVIIMVQIALIGIIVVLMAIQFKNTKSEYALYISLVGCMLIFYLGINKLDVIINSIKKIQTYINFNQTYISILIKIIGITYIAEFSSNICKDSGHTAVANQIELVGKLTILATGMPILMALLDTINEFLTA
ncbi:MAG: stage sporulation protein [Anaerocolumna sp.]|jgi:stage III sporulation protein AD|nr:stage sporulation protein [Anaerocolumna sp.]